MSEDKRITEYWKLLNESLRHLEKHYEWARKADSYKEKHNIGWCGYCLNEPDCEMCHNYDLGPYVGGNKN